MLAKSNSGIRWDIKWQKLNFPLCFSLSSSSLFPIRGGKISGAWTGRAAQRAPGRRRVGKWRGGGPGGRAAGEGGRRWSGGVRWGARCRPPYGRLLSRVPRRPLPAPDENRSCGGPPAPAAGPPSANPTRPLFAPETFHPRPLGPFALPRRLFFPPRPPRAFPPRGAPGGPPPSHPGSQTAPRRGRALPP